MNTSKIIKGVVGGGRYTVTAPIIKEDYGLYLQIEGIELPETYEVDFSNDEHSGTSVTMLGIADIIGNSEGETASQAYSVGDVLLYDGKLYKVTASIAQGSAIVPNTNCTQTTIIDLLRGV